MFLCVIARHSYHRCIYLAVTIIFADVVCMITFFIKNTCFGHFVIMWSSDPHLKHLRGVRSICLLDETWTARAFSIFFLILLKHWSVYLLTPSQNMQSVWTACALSLSLPKSELISRFRSSGCSHEMFSHFWSVYLFFSSQFCLVASYLSRIFFTLFKVIQKCLHKLIFRIVVFYRNW